jgi:hypothetical protein
MTQQDISADKGYDWTRKYSAYENYDDIEELKMKAEEERKKEDNLRKKAGRSKLKYLFL